VLQTQLHPNFTYHNGGSQLFGPDGCLCGGLGDGGSEGDPNGNEQNMRTLLAKIIPSARPTERYARGTEQPVRRRAGCAPRR
jgi:hypothetical protein